MNKELQQKLKKYSATAVAIVATTTAADAQLVYQWVNKTINAPTPTGDAIDSVDMNSDGKYDIAMVAYAPTSSVNIVYGFPWGSQSHELAGSAPSGSNYPFKLNAGDQINTQSFLPANSYGTFTWVEGGVNPFNSFWNGGVTDGYLGVKLKISGNTHYGWIRMDIAASGKTIVIKDMVYNATANGPLTAGQGMDVELYEQIANSMWIADNMLRTDILVEFSKAQLTIMDVGGKAIESFNLNSGTEVFDLNHLPAGTYILSLAMEGNVYNKKAVVY